MTREPGEVEQRAADLLNTAIGRLPWLNGDETPSDVSYDDLVGGLAEVVHGLGESVLLIAREIDLLRDEISHRS